jgi:serine/threonine protein kinase
MMVVVGDEIIFESLGPIILDKLHDHGANANVFAANKGSKKYAIKIHHARSLLDGIPDTSFTAEVDLKFEGSRLCIPLETCHVYQNERNKSQIALAFPMLSDHIILDTVFQDRTSYDLAFRQHIAQELVLAVLELHNSGWLHGDLQPRNIMVNKSTGDIKLIDFEWSMPIGHASEGADQLGVEDWCAPELLQFGRRAHTINSEVWTLARMLLQLLGKNAKEEFLRVKQIGVLEHAQKIGASQELYSIEPESSELSLLCSMLHKGVITNQNERCEIHEILNLMKFDSPIMKSEIDIVQADKRLNLKNATISIQIIDAEDNRYRCRTGKTRKYEFNNGQNIIEIDLSNINQPEIIFSEIRSPLGNGYSIKIDDYTWSIKAIEVYL